MTFPLLNGGLGAGGEESIHGGGNEAWRLGATGSRITRFHPRTHWIMADNEFASMTDDALGERFRSLMGAYDNACKAYDRARAADIHREFYVVEEELRSRRSDDWRRTGLETLSVAKLIERFRSCAVAYEDADGSDATEHLYWDIEDVKQELQRREGDQRRALFNLYTDPDIRVRALAARATRTLAPLLSEHREQNIDDDDWAPPASGLDIVQAGLSAIFPAGARKPSKLIGLSVEQLVEWFTALTIKQHEALQRDEIARYNRLFGQVSGIVHELKCRDSDQRKSLMVLFSHSNPQVRLMAAQATLLMAPIAARQTLQEIWDRNEFPQAAQAMGTLRALERGDRVPD